MNKYDLISKIEEIAPLDTQESWDCSGWIIDNSKPNVSKVMLALTITDKIINQAREKKCDLIISHHPMFEVPVCYKDIQIYSSHTPMDKAKGGTTETLLKALGFNKFVSENEFVRTVYFDSEINVSDIKSKLEQISKNIKIVNNNNISKIKSLAFCSGSGSEFIYSTTADAFVTGDVKYHTAVECDKIIFDIGHFESEILILDVIQNILGIDVEIGYEKSPFN